MPCFRGPTPTDPIAPRLAGPRKHDTPRRPDLFIMGPLHRKQVRSYNTPGHAHELTFSCFHRLPLLNRDRTRHWLLDALDAARRRRNLALWAYVVMPEHVHVIVWPREAVYEVRLIRTALKVPVHRKALTFLRCHAPEFPWPLAGRAAERRRASPLLAAGRRIRPQHYRPDHAAGHDRVHSQQPGASRTRRPFRRTGRGPAPGSTMGSRIRLFRWTRFPALEGWCGRGG